MEITLLKRYCRQDKEDKSDTAPSQDEVSTFVAGKMFISVFVGGGPYCLTLTELALGVLTLNWLSVTAVLLDPLPLAPLKL